MSKSILMSIQPQYVAKILNGEKTIEVRKKFPKDYVGWVYIYCTKGKRNGDNWLRKYPFCLSKNIYQVQDDNFNALNGYVVARFWCDKVEEIKYHPYECTFYTDTVDTVISADNPVSSFEKASGLSYYDLSDYLYNGKDKVGYAIHISKLEVFDKPRRINDFIKYNKNTLHIDNCIIGFGFGSCERLTNAPQSWCYIEGE